MFFLTWSPKLWCFKASLSRIVDESLERPIWNIGIFDGNVFYLYYFLCVELWITEVSLQLNRWFVDDSLKNTWSYSGDFVAHIKDHKCFFKPNLRNIDVSLLLHRWSLMILWRDKFETLIISMASFDVYCFFVLASESLTSHCWFIDESLMIFRRKFDVTLKISMQTIMIINVSFT